MTELRIDDAVLTYTRPSGANNLLWREPGETVDECLARHLRINTERVKAFSAVVAEIEQIIETRK